MQKVEALSPQHAAGTGKAAVACVPPADTAVQARQLPEELLTRLVRGRFNTQVSLASWAHLLSLAPPFCNPFPAFLVLMELLPPRASALLLPHTLHSAQEYPVSLERLYELTPEECIPEFYTDPSGLAGMHLQRVL